MNKKAKVNCKNIEIKVKTGKNNKVDIKVKIFQIVFDLNNHTY